MNHLNFSVMLTERKREAIPSCSTEMESVLDGVYDNYNRVCASADNDEDEDEDDDRRKRSKLEYLKLSSYIMRCVPIKH